jgi:hypothetical protein
VKIRVSGQTSIALQRDVVPPKATNNEKNTLSRSDLGMTTLFLLKIVTMLSFASRRVSPSVAFLSRAFSAIPETMKVSYNGACWR